MLGAGFHKVVDLAFVDHANKNAVFPDVDPIGVNVPRNHAATFTRRISPLSLCKVMACNCARALYALLMA